MHGRQMYAISHVRRLLPLERHGAAKSASSDTDLTDTPKRRDEICRVPETSRRRYGSTQHHAPRGKLAMPEVTSDTLICGWAKLSTILGRSRTQLWRDIRAGEFPPPLELGRNSVAWQRSEINDWLASRRRRTYRR